VATSILEVKGIGLATAKVLAENGINSAEELATAKLGTIMTIPGFSETRALRTIAAAEDVVRSAPKSSAKTPAKATKKKTAPKKKSSPKKEKKKKKPAKSKKDKAKKDKKDKKPAKKKADSKKKTAKESSKKKK
jgi:hypothetical protein